MQMRRLCDRTEILETREVDGRVFEVCAHETAHFDDGSRECVVRMESFVRAVNPRGTDRELHPSWLPQPDTTRHEMELDEALEESREMFRRWTSKVRAAIPDAEGFSRSVRQGVEKRS
jgi:hypothetical protein